jgi:hypothetical protein
LKKPLGGDYPSVRKGMSESGSSDAVLPRRLTVQRTRHEGVGPGRKSVTRTDVFHF